MDSLLASYASSDEEDERLQPKNLSSKSTKPSLQHSTLSTSHSNSSSSLFASLPQPKSSSLFSTMPAPKYRNSVSAPQVSETISSGPATKKVVQFRPPPIGLSRNSLNDEDDDDDDEEEDKKKKQNTNIGTSTVKSLFSSMPAPKNSVTLGALPSVSGTSRRSVLEADTPATSDSSLVNNVKDDISTVAGNTATMGYYADMSSYNQASMDPNASLGYAASIDYSNLASGSENCPSYDVNNSYQSDGAVDGNYDWGGGSGDYGNYGSGYANNATYGQSVNNSTDGSSINLPRVENSFRIPGKRGRNDVPTEIIEVSQDDLMKDRPREDQAKSTGIAFGPSYQPVSAKGKPSKLLKRKHQISSLYFDMKQNETLLQERRSKGLLTKAQTHAKYGWA